MSVATLQADGAEPARDGTVDAITLEVLRHRLWMINDEQGRLAEQISGSPVVYESKDFNSSLLTPAGDSIFIGVYTTRIAMSLHVATKYIIAHHSENPGFGEGDAFITNDPWMGAGHQNDYLVLAPLYGDGDLVGWTGIAMHDVDVGGPVPGGFTAGAKDIFNEPPLIPPLKLVEGGQVRRDVEALVLRNSRTPELNALNLRARLAAVSRTRERVDDIIRHYGKDVFVETQQRILDLVRRAFARRLSELPNGTWIEEGFLDHDSNHDELYRIRLALTKRDDRLIFDFTGTAAQVEGPVNCTWVGMESGVISAVLPTLCYDMPWSPGALTEVLDIRAPDGLINNARYPAAVSMATVGATYATQQVASSAIGRMLTSAGNGRYRDEAQANWTSSWQGTIVSGSGRDGAEFTGVLLDQAGGAGALAERDGPDTSGIPGSPSQAIANVESYERQYPLLYVYRKQCPDTGGAGRFRGGVGSESLIVPHRAPAPVNYIVTAHGVSHPEARGLYGGYPGSVQVRLLLRRTNLSALFAKGVVPSSLDEIVAETTDVLAAIDRGVLEADDALVAVASGGGGFGDPLDRAPDRVVRDHRTGLCSAAAARDVYGVIIDSGGLDRAATLQRRRALRAQRLAEAVPADAAAGHPRVLDGGDSDTSGVIGGCLKRLARNGAVVHVCSACGTTYGPVADDPKRYAVMRELPISAFSPWNRYGLVVGIKALEFYCRGCGLLIGTQVRKKDDPLLWDMSLAG